MLSIRCLELENDNRLIINLILFHSFCKFWFVCWWLGQDKDAVENVPQFGVGTDNDVNVIYDLKCYQFLIARRLPLKPPWHILFSFLLVRDEMTSVDFLTV